MRILQDDPERLVLRDRTSWVAFFCWGAGLILAAFAAAKGQPRALISAALSVGFGVAFFRSSTVVFDKVGRSCTLKRRDIWKVTSRDVPLDTISDILVDPMPGSDMRTAIPCRLSLLTTFGEAPLSSTYEPELDRFQSMRSSILKSLGKQGSTPATADPLESLMRAGRRVDAIALLRTREALSLEDALKEVDAIHAKNGAKQS